MQTALTVRGGGFGLGQMMRWVAPLVLAIAVVIGGCSSDPETRKTEERTATGVGVGAAAGAAGGALFGAMAGSPGTGAAIGAGVGAVAGGAGGYIYDQHKKRDASEAENERLRRENEQLRQQQ